MADNAAAADVSVLRRICLRLDNGTRIGSSSALGMSENGSGVVKLDFVEGFTRGLVSETDLIRISEIAGQLEARRHAASTPTSVAGNKVGKVRSNARDRLSHTAHEPRL